MYVSGYVNKMWTLAKILRNELNKIELNWNELEAYVYEYKYENNNLQLLVCILYYVNNK